MQLIEKNSTTRVHYQSHDLEPGLDVRFTLRKMSGDKVLDNVAADGEITPGLYYKDFTSPNEDTYLYGTGSVVGGAISHVQAIALQVDSPVDDVLFYADGNYLTAQIFSYKIYTLAGDIVQSGTLDELNDGFYNTLYNDLADEVPYFFEVDGKIAALAVKGNKKKGKFSSGSAMGDSMEALLLALAHITEGVKTSNQFNVVLNALSNISEGIKGGDELSVIINVMASLSEKVKSGKQFVAVLTTLQSIVDTVKVSDNLSAVLNAVRTIIEGAKNSDQLSAVLTSIQSVSETSKTSDQLIATITKYCEITAKVKTGTQLSSVANVVKELSEGVKTGDELVGILTALAAYSEGAKSGKQLVAIITTTRITTDETVAGDSFEAIVIPAIPPEKPPGRDWTLGVAYAIPKIGGGGGGVRVHTLTKEKKRRKKLKLNFIFLGDIYEYNGICNPEVVIALDGMPKLVESDRKLAITIQELQKV
jgi:hypothetical protein